MSEIVELNEGSVKVLLGSGVTVVVRREPGQEIDETVLLGIKNLLRLVFKEPQVVRDNMIRRYPYLAALGSS